MANILSMLHTTANALGAYDQVLQVTQNNVANASTPGYARQTQSLYALPFDLSAGDAGGVRAGPVESSRDEYAEQAVRNQTVLLGAASQDVSSLTSLQTIFDISGATGVPYALNNLLQSFSAWGQSPTSGNARQAVIDRAGELASAFNGAASSLSRIGGDAEQQIQTTVTRVNQLVGQLQHYNTLLMSGGGNDSALDAQVHATLEQLSQYVDVTATRQDNNSWSVLLGGQVTLLVGTQQYALSSDLEQPADPPPSNPGGPPQAVVRAADGTNINSKIVTGQLGALLNFRNSVLASYIGDAYQPGDLNTMAQQFADRVNTLLEGGNVSDGPPPVTGVALFTYDTANPTDVARSLRVNPAISASQLAAIQPGPPEIANGVPLALSNLANPQSAQDQVEGQSYTSFYGNLASRVGGLLSQATDLQQVQQSAVAQAKNVREQTSGVDYDEEAMTLLQFQRAYDANSKLIGVLNQITADAVNIIGSAG